MTVEQSGVFLTASILTMLGFIVVAVGIIVINNLLHTYWKPVRIFSRDSWFFNPPPAAFEQREVEHERHQEKRNERS